MPAADDAVLQRRPQYRRRLRSRIILSFLLLGTGLTLLFAFLSNEARNQIENDLVEDVVNRNIDEAARRFALNPKEAGAPVTQLRAFYYTPDKFEALRRNRPEWFQLKDGIYNFTDYNNILDDGSGQPKVYKLGVRKTPQAWFYLAYDTSQTVRGEERFQSWLLLSVLLFSAFSLVIGWWSASRVMRPVSELAQRLHDSGDTTTPSKLAPYFADDEVGELAKALDEYSARLTEVVQRDREFNADVSHELRTPLAVIKGAVELLLSRPDLDEKSRTRLQRIQRAEQQCTDLISALLLLSRSERGHGATDVAKVADQLLDALRIQIGSKPLTLRLEGKPGQVVIDAPEAAVTVALGNLVGNAVKYTSEGEVLVRLLDNAVEVIDTGPGLSAEDAAKLFERGYRGSHAEHSQGGGIGLSIVRRLCALYEWNVRVVPGEAKGVIATLAFSPESLGPERG